MVIHPIKFFIIKYWYKGLLLIDTIDKESIDTFIQQTSKKFNVSGKRIFFPIRAVLYGKFQGPDLYTLISILGIKESTKRLKKYI